MTSYVGRLMRNLAMGAVMVPAVAGMFYGCKTTKEVEDRSKPIYKVVETTCPETKTKYHTFKKGETVWKVTADIYKLKTGNCKPSKEISDKVKQVVKQNAPEHEHYDKHLLDDTKAVGDNCTALDQADGIPGDEIRAGDKLEYTITEQVPCKQTTTEIIGYQKKQVTESKTPWGWLFGGLGAAGAGGLGYYFWKKNKPQGPQGPKTGGAGPGGTKPKANSPKNEGIFSKQGGKETGSGSQAYADSGVNDNVVNFAAYKGRRTLDDSELQNARNDILKKYKAGERSVSRLVRDYAGLSTNDGYKFIACDKLSKTEPVTYKWNKRLAEATGELDGVESKIKAGRASGKTAKQIAQEIKDATQFEMSTSTIYRMAKKLGVQSEAAAMFA